METVFCSPQLANHKYYPDSPCLDCVRETAVGWFYAGYMITDDIY